jgi:hypothetical protein
MGAAWSEGPRPETAADHGPAARPTGTTSTRSYCKSHIEYLARLLGAIPPQQSHSAGHLCGDLAFFVHRKRLRRLRPFRSARNADSKAQ